MIVDVLSEIEQRILVWRFSEPRKTLRQCGQLCALSACRVQQKEHMAMMLLRSEYRKAKRECDFNEQEFLGSLADEFSILRESLATTEAKFVKSRKEISKEWKRKREETRIRNAAEAEKHATEMKSRQEAAEDRARRYREIYQYEYQQRLQEFRELQARIQKWNCEFQSS